jgi:iron complex transport system permease protein
MMDEAGQKSNMLKRIGLVSLILLCLLFIAGLLGISLGSSQSSIKDVLKLIGAGGEKDAMLASIIWHIRFPRVILAALVGSTLSLGGVVFQALLRNPLAEPYILGISGGSAIGAIIGILMGFSRFPGVCLCAFAGSMATLGLVILMGTGQSSLKKDSLLLSGVMINAFCSSVITFLISLSQDARIHNILFWLMGDLSVPDIGQAVLLSLIVFPCFLLIFRLSNTMNLMLMGRELAQTMGVHTTAVMLTLLTTTSLMVSATVSYCGLLGFVGLVMPHLLRLILGPDHRILVPACILGGGTYMILCDLLARILPKQGEMPTGVITALIGAPLFIWLLKRSRT